MDLEDVIDPECGLQQDEWSLTAPTFGEEGQLTVIGWSGRKGPAKFYILICSICTKDNELFGEGYFRSAKSSLVKGQIPCGCSISPRRTKQQYLVLCERAARKINYEFMGFTGEWKYSKSGIRMLCNKHGEWDTGNINSLLSRLDGCPVCQHENTSSLMLKPDDVMIQSFLASGTFHPDTKFWRSDRKNSLGHKPYWSMHCAYCGEIGESTSSDLQKGCLPCVCSKQRQTECYINLLIDGYDNTVAVKFGIARDSKQRIKKQNRLSAYTLHQHSVYVFPNVISCKQAERECRQELECGIVLKRDMKDGYTETTWPYNLENIIEIYERNGGVKK